MRNLGSIEVPTIELSAEDLAIVAAGTAKPFLKLGDIKGESTDDKHKDWIEVLS